MRSVTACAEGTQEDNTSARQPCPHSALSADSHRTDALSPSIISVVCFRDLSSFRIYVEF